MRHAWRILLLPILLALALADTAQAEGGGGEGWKDRVAPSLLARLERGARRLDCLVVVRTPVAGAAGGTPTKVGLPVVATPPETIAELMQAFAPRGLKVTRRFDHFPVARMSVPAAVLPEIAAHAGVVGVAPIRTVHALQTAGGALVGAPGVAALGYDGRGVGVAVLDTGVDAGGFPPARVVRLEVGSSARSGGDPSGHGTSVAGIIAGPRWGVAPAAEIVAVPVLGRSGEGDSARVLAGIDAVLASIAAGDPYHIRVVTLAFGGYDDEDWPPGAGACDGVSPDFAAAFAALRDAGVLVVAAAGNGGCATGVAWPACISGALAVGAVYDAHTCTMSLPPPFGCGSYAQSHGPGRCTPQGCSDETEADRIACYSDSGEALALWAPAGCARTLGAGGAYLDCFDGTSAAAAYVSGAAALLAQAVPGRSADEMRRALTTTGPTLEDGRNGVRRGRLDAVAALGRLREACTVPPVPQGFASDVAKSCGGGRVTLRWKPVKGASGYRLQVATSADFAGARDVSVAGTDFTYQPEAGAASVLNFRVASLSPCGSSAWSGTVQVRYEPRCAAPAKAAEQPGQAPPAPAPAVSGEEVYYLPGVAGNHAGSGGSRWFTDLALSNPNDSPARIQVAFIGDQPNASDTISVTMTAGSDRSFREVLSSLLGISRDAAGYLVLTADHKLGVAGFTYARGATGGKGEGIGQSIPAFTASEAVSGAQGGMLAGLRSDGPFRTNLELINVGDVPAEVDVRLVSGSGKGVGTVSLPRLAPGRRVQKAHILPPGMAAAYATVSVKPLNARVVGFASVVNGATGEAITAPLKPAR